MALANSSSHAEASLKFLKSFQPLGLLFLRATAGLIFFTHGYPKLTRSAAALQSLFMQHGLPVHWFYVEGVLETFGGALLVIGLFTRPAALLLAIEMAYTIATLISSHSIMALREYEFPLVLGAASVALATVGAGTLSVDHLLFDEGTATKPRTSKPFRR
jgi:putative oxidoreductase